MPFLDRIARYEHTVAGLRSVAEGMALFAEFDVDPGPCECTALPLWHLALLAGPPDPGDDLDHDVARLLARVLMRMRGTTSLIRHRELMLGMAWLKPYPTGYIALRGWWERLRSVSELAADSELFLCFIRRWFYEDFELVELLLDPFEPGRDRRVAINEHLDARFTRFRDDQEAVAAGLHRYADDGWRGESVVIEHPIATVTTNWFGPEASAIDKTRWERGRRRLDECERAFLDSIATRLPEEQQSSFVRLLAGRAYGTIADERVPVATSPGGDPEPVLDEPFATDPPPEGRLIVLYFGYWPNEVGILYITSDNEKRGVRTFGFVPDEFTKQAADGRIDPHRLREVSKEWHSEVRKLLYDQPWSDGWIADRELSQKNAGSRAFLQALAALEVVLPEAAEVLVREGVAGLLGDAASADLLTLLSWTGDDEWGASRDPSELAVEVIRVASQSGLQLVGPCGSRL